MAYRPGSTPAGVLGCLALALLLVALVYALIFLAYSIRPTPGA